MPTNAELLAAYEDGSSYAAIADYYGLDVNGVRSRVNKARRKLELAALQRELTELRQRVQRLDNPLHPVQLGNPLALSGDWIIVGDVHCNTVRGDFFQRPLDIAARYLTAPRQLIIAGDLLNADTWSSYEPTYAPASWENEIQATRYFLELYLKTFDRIVILVGNHELRVTRRTHAAITPELLMRMVSTDERVTVSHFGHCVIESPSGAWRITHGSDYSVNQLTVTATLADKFHQHIIGHHQHHLAIGWSRFGQYVCVDNGGLFDCSQMAYVQIEDSKKPTMKVGFTLLKGGSPYLFGDAPFTDWNYWLA